MLSLGTTRTSTCGGVRRRSVLSAAGAGLLGLHLEKVHAAEEALGRGGSARSVIFLHLFGGPSQLETFDLKPDAPSQIRGPFNPIPCKTPGLLIGEHLPKLAAISDRYCVIRTMSHPHNDHSGGGHYIQTGHRWHVPIGGGFSPTPEDWPSMGSIVQYVETQRLKGQSADLPAYVVLPNTLGHLQERGQYPRPGEHAGWLGKAYNPLTTGIEKRTVEDNPYWRDCADSELVFQPRGLSPRAEIRLDRLDGRRRLLDRFDSARGRLDAVAEAAEFDRFKQRALAIVSSDRTRKALDVTQEPAAVRDRYGRHLFGQSCLTARRLVEAGCRFVTVHYDCVDGYSWDSHRNSADVKQHLLPTADQGAAALIEDLDTRGLLKDTLVVMLGEMGRTPKANKDWGRDHWSTLFPALVAGGGVRGGIVYGKSDAQAAFATEDIVRPEDLAATIYQALGIPCDLTVPDRQGRPTPVVVDDGRPVTAIFG